MCKMLLTLIILCSTYFHSISAIQCPSCDEIYFDATNASDSVNQFYCEQTDISAALCRSELFVDLIDPYSAAIRYLTFPANALVTDNGERELITTIYLPLDIGYPYASVIYSCYDKDLCNNDSVVQERYEQLRALNYTKLEKKLGELLHNDQNILRQRGIECYHGNKKTIICSTDSQCQATLTIERGRADSVSTTCVPDRRPGARTGLVVQSKSIGEDYKKTSVLYTCNKDKCNQPSVVSQVRQILFDAELLDSKAQHSNFLSIGLLIICTLISISFR